MRSKSQQTTVMKKKPDKMQTTSSYQYGKKHIIK